MMTPPATPTPTTTSGAIPPDAASIDAHLSTFAGQRVAVAMSGGVDSAVAALRLVRAGADVVGLSLRLHDPDPHNPMAPRACCPPEDLQDGRRVAEALGFPFYVVDARAAFNERVVRPFVGAYVAGRTPNPCVGCNSFVKLGRLAQRARALGCTALATGHFARLDQGPQGPRLFRGADLNKDQSYFLFAVQQDILQYLTFPLGAWSKAQVRAEAVQSGLPVAHKLESQEVCFVGGAGAGKFVMSQPEAEGEHAGRILNEAGQEMGRHQGVMGYTVGQRKGLGIAHSNPLHVLSIDAEAKTLVVGEAPALARRGLIGDQASWPSGLPESPFTARIRIRYRDRGAMGTVFPEGPEGVRVEFDTPVRAVAPGQAVVFERGDEIVGGAWIQESLR